MLLRLRSLILWAVLFSTVSIGYADAASASLSCGSFLQKVSPPKNVNYYINAVSKKSGFEPKFLNPAKEAKMAENWKGTKKGPTLMTETLNEKTAFIDQQLLAADAGTVKSASAAGFVSMRLRHMWNDKDMSTNLGVSSDSLITKTLEGSTKLVPKTAQAVFIFMHGWGTKTTGHHVAAAFSNFLAPYGIVVLSIDAPHHAYGPRVSELSPKEYATYLRDFRKEFIPEDVPTFIGGHSGGGFIADMMMRFSDDPTLGLKEAFSGAINLSGPMDGAPGKSLAEKSAAENLINSDPEIMNLVPEAERDLSVLLLTQGKTSAISGLSAETFMSSVNWAKPDHKGADYLPTLVVMGERDGLYVGREKVFEEYLANLSNTETHVMGLRPDFKGNDNWVSHMIFDHYRSGTKDPETFNVVKDFIEKQVGPLKKKKGSTSLATDADSSKIGILVNVVQEYYNNLAFRKFAKEFVYTIKTPSVEAQEIGAKSGKANKLLKRTQGELGRLKKRDPENPRIDALKKREAFLASESSRLRSLMTSKFVPEGQLKDFASQNVNTRMALETEMSAKLKEKQSSVKELRTLRTQVYKDQKAFDALVERLVVGETLKDPEVLAVQQEIEDTLDIMVDLQIKMNELNSNLVAENFEKGLFAVNPGPKEIKVYAELDTAFANYNTAMAKGRVVVAKAIGDGKVSDQDLEVFNNLYGTVEAYASDSPTAESLLGRTKTVEIRTEALDRKIESLSKEKDDLLKAYVKQVTPGLYTFSQTTLFAEMNKPLTQLINSSAGIEPLWRIWSDLWKERPPEQSTSLY